MTTITTEAALALANVCNYSPTLGTAEKWLAEAGQMIEALVQERDELKREQSLASEVQADAAAQDAELKLLRGLLKECRSHVARAAADDGDLHATELLEQLEKLGIAAGEQD